MDQGKRNGGERRRREGKSEEREGKEKKYSDRTACSKGELDTASINFCLLPLLRAPFSSVLGRREGSREGKSGHKPTEDGENGASCGSVRFARGRKGSCRWRWGVCRCESRAPCLSILSRGPGVGMWL